MLAGGVHSLSWVSIGTEKIGRPGRDPLRHLAGADELLVERLGAACLVRPFDHWLDQPMRSADDAQIGLPLGAGNEALAIAVS